MNSVREMISPFSPRSDVFRGSGRTRSTLAHIRGWLARIRPALKHIMEHRDTRRIFLFLCVNVAFMVLEVVVGLASGSLGLIGDASHMCVDSAALVVGLAAACMASMKKSGGDRGEQHSAARTEAIGGFLNSLLLLGIAVAVGKEAVERLHDPQPVAVDAVLIGTSVAGLAVNLVGIFFFHDTVHHHGHNHGPSDSPVRSCASCSSSSQEPPQPEPESEMMLGAGWATPAPTHARRAKKAAMLGEGWASPAGGCCFGCEDHDVCASASSSTTSSSPCSPSSSCTGHNNLGVFLHILADTLGSVGVLVSSLLIHHLGWHWVDPACSLCISLLIFASSVPLLRGTTNVLLNSESNKPESHIL